jgi:hypothetical protein
MIVEVGDLAEEIEKEMPTPRKTKRFQPLSNSEDLDEESIDDEQKKERRENCKE